MASDVEVEQFKLLVYVGKVQYLYVSMKVFDFL